jgi:hypothetical protein
MTQPCQLQLLKIEATKLETALESKLIKKEDDRESERSFRARIHGGVSAQIQVTLQGIFSATREISQSHPAKAITPVVANIMGLNLKFISPTLALPGICATKVVH